MQLRDCASPEGLLGQEDSAELSQRSFLGFVQRDQDRLSLVGSETHDRDAMDDGVAELFSEVVINLSCELLNEVDGNRYASEVNQEGHGACDSTRPAACLDRWKVRVPTRGLM